MGEPALKQERFTYQEYLEIEAASPERHIFWDGEIFAMAGASTKHYTVESKLHGLLFASLRRRPCQPYTGNCRLRAMDSERAVFADVIVVCGPMITHPDDDYAVTNPTIVFEVLSKRTEAFDRGDKFTYYRTFPSLRSVVFLSQKTVHVERYIRGDDNIWSLRDLGPEGVLDLPEIGASVDLAELYEGVPLGGPEE